MCCCAGSHEIVFHLPDFEKSPSVECALQEDLALGIAKLMAHEIMITCYLCAVFWKEVKALQCCCCLSVPAGWM